MLTFRCLLAFVAFYCLSITVFANAQEQNEVVYASPNVEALLAEKARQRQYDARWAHYGNAIVNRPSFYSIWQLDHQEVLSFDARVVLEAHEVRYELCLPILSVEDSLCLPIDDLVRHENVKFAGSMTQHGPYKHRHVARITLKEHKFDGEWFPEKSRFFIKVRSAYTKEEIFSTEPFIVLNPNAPVAKDRKLVQFERTPYTKLGQGGFGEVFRGTMLDRYRTPVAVKIIRVDNADEWWEVHNEIHALKSLNHPNILSLLLHWEERNRQSLSHEMFLVSELAFGGDLEDLMSDPHIHEWMRKKGHFQHVLKQLISGLDYMHSKGYIHRDIKPANILIMTANYDEGSTRPPKIKIADLGLTCFASGKCKTWRNMVCGTKYYMAPEMTDTQMVELPPVHINEIQDVTMKTYREEHQSLPATPVAACMPILPPNNLLMDDAHDVQFKTFYGSSVDMWAVGAIAFRFMSGDEQGGRLSRKLETVRPGNAEGLSQTDPMALDFLTSLLIRNGNLRISAAEAVKHPYLHPHLGMTWPWQSKTKETHGKQKEMQTMEELVHLAENEGMLVDIPLSAIKNDPLLNAVQHDAKQKKTHKASNIKYRVNKSKYLMARLLHRKQRSAMEMQRNKQKARNPAQHAKKHQQMQVDYMNYVVPYVDPKQNVLPSEAFRKGKQLRMFEKVKASLHKDRAERMESFGRTFDSLRLSEL